MTDQDVRWCIMFAGKFLAVAVTCVAVIAILAYLVDYLDRD